MTDHLLQTVPLGVQWPTLDPFLFCVHHDDAYPAGNEELGPDATLDGRDLGQDFAGVDGWNMYHGRRVPGFPQHPHRGFETVTLVRSGLIDHSDSLGAAARFGGGDVQWLTAGRGINHAEMFPLLERDDPNPLELFQIWLNLPARDKMVEPSFTMLWNEHIPRLAVTDEDGRSVTVTIVAGELAGHRPPPPPPDSWASRPESDLAIWVVSLPAGASWELPAAAGPDTVRTLYAFEGDRLLVGDEPVQVPSAAVVRCDGPALLTAGDEPVEVLVLQGRPIGEPVEQYGPFVMNDREGIQQAFEDYRRTGFGGWPWPADDPVHGTDPERFARHPDGRTERAGIT